LTVTVILTDTDKQNSTEQYTG